MNLRDLKYLVALADHCHFGKAAEACFVSQPTLSMQIKKLEQSLGVQLLERTNKSVLLTDIGAIIVTRARTILNQAKEIHTIAKSASDPHGGELRIGVIPTLGPYLLPQIVTQLAHLFPKLKLYWLEDQTATLVDKLKRGSIDTIIAVQPLAESDFVNSPLFEEEFVLAVAASHSLAKKNSIKELDLADKILLLLEEGHCLREQALSLCYKMNATETKNFQATSLETLRHMVAANAGITLMPKLACQSNDGIAYIPFAAPIPRRSIALFWRTSSAREILLHDIAKHIKTMMQKNY